MRRLIRIVAATAVVTLSLAAQVAAAPPSPFTIETEINLESSPFHGTFAVTEGAPALGCAGGTFVDTPLSGGLGQIEKHFTCTSDPGAGSEFFVRFKNDCTFRSRGTFRCRPGDGYLGRVSGRCKAGPATSKGSTARAPWSSSARATSAPRR
jgi:hypothetical protein